MFESDDTPIEGKGEEMLPVRGLPFQEAGPSQADDSPEGQPGKDFLSEKEIREREAELADDFSTQFRPITDTESLEEDVGFAAARVPVELSMTDKEAIMMESGAGLLRDEEMEGMGQPPAEEAFPAETAPPPGLDGGGGAGFEVPDRDLEAFPGEPGAGLPVPPPSSSQGMPLFNQDAFASPGPIQQSAEAAMAPEIVRDLKASNRLLGLIVTDERVQELWKRGDDLQKAVIKKVEDLELARTLLELVRSSKTQLLSGKANFEEAERAINEVDFRVAHAERSKKWTRLGHFLFVYELLWGILLILGLYFVFFSSLFFLNMDTTTLFSEDEVFIVIGGALSGGLGGVTGAFYALWRYITSQKFSPQYRIWYITQPILGLLIGTFIFLFIKVGFNVTAGTVSVEIGSPWVVFLLSFVGGFQQNVLLSIVKQVLKLFKIGGDEEKEEDRDALQIRG